jgi:CheY-like chemotaxis protein
VTHKPTAGIDRALVVDDHLISREFTVAALRQWVRCVKQATNLSEAVSQALTWLPDLLLVDVNLPDGSGLELPRRIRNRWPPARPLPRVVVLTGKRDVMDAAPAIRKEISCMLVKPVTVAQLKTAVSSPRGGPARETPTRGPGAQLPGLFRTELLDRLPDLERALSRSDRGRAAFILHQLIASSAMCGETQLEADLRALDRSVCGGSDAAEIVESWCRVTASSSHFLNRIEVADAPLGGFRR